MKAFHLLPIASVLLAGCAGTQHTTELYDGVYDKPLYAAVAPVEKAGENDDYYDPATAGQYQPSYYDMAYNDPYYYNYGRFGFDAGLQYGASGGNGSYWGAGYGQGSSAYDPWCNSCGSPYGSGYWGSPYGGSYGSPYGGCYGNGWNDPWYNGGYSGYGYYGYGGGCYSCYQPIVVCGAPTVVAHRPSLGGGGGGRPGGGGNEGTSDMGAPQISYARSMVSLRPAAMQVLRPDLYVTRTEIETVPIQPRTGHFTFDRIIQPRLSDGGEDGGGTRGGGGRIEPMRGLLGGGGDGGGGGGRTVHPAPATLDQHRSR